MNIDVWLPLLLAGLLQTNDYDQKLQEHIYNEKPIFGNKDNALEWSDHFQNYTTVAYITTGFIEQPIEIVLYEIISVEGIIVIKNNLQEGIKDERPISKNDDGMPSGHAMISAYQAKLATINYQPIGISTNIAAFMSGYARIEQGAHYPSQVLTGWGLGNLMGDIAENYFNKNINVTPFISTDIIGLSWRYSL